MSSSVVSPAQWSGQLPHTNPTVDNAPSNRRAKPVSTKMTNGQGSNDKKPKSISPVPTTSTRSTRSRRAVAYGESDSPELPAKPLPTIPNKPVIRIKKKPTTKRVTSARMARTYSGDSQTDSQKTTSSEESPSTLHPPLPANGEEILLDNPSETEIVATATPEPVKADLPPTGSALKISFKSNGGIKRIATSQDPDDASTTYDATPRISPTSDVPTGVKGDAEVNGAPARAPRKKRKWLKRGEVDPDDPIAVAKQRDRHALINEGDEILLQEIAAVRAGTHPALLALHAQLEVRRDIQLGYAKNRYDLKMAENLKVKRQAQAQARGDHHEASEQTLAELNADLRRRKHAAINEKLQIGRTSDSYPSLSFGRGGKGWPIHTEKLISNQQTPMIEFKIDGQARQRKDHTVHLATLSTSDARSDWDLIKSAIANENEPPSSPDPRRHLADSPRRQPVAGPSRQVMPSQPAGPPRNTIWQKNVYDVKDLPAYRAGSGSSVPMRQTPTHSPTPSRRPSPPPAPVAGPSIPRLPVASGSGPAYSTLTNGAGPSVPRAPHPQSFASVYSQR